MAESNAGSIYNNERWREEREKEEGREERDDAARGTE